MPSLGILHVVIFIAFHVPHYFSYTVMMFYKVLVIVAWIVMENNRMLVVLFLKTLCMYDKDHCHLEMKGNEMIPNLFGFYI